MTTSSEALTLLNRVAELRAHGTPWTETAKQLAIDADAMHRLVSDHQRDYDKLARRARAEAARETFTAAMTTLRNLLKSEDPRVGILAATTIVRYEMTRMRQGAKAASERLDREFRNARTRHNGAFEQSELNVSESANVQKSQGLATAKNSAQNASSPAVVKPVAVQNELARKRARLLLTSVCNVPTRQGAAPCLDSWLAAPVQSGKRT